MPDELLLRCVTFIVLRTIQEVGLEEHLRTNLFCIESDVKLLNSVGLSSCDGTVAMMPDLFVMFLSQEAHVVVVLYQCL